MRVGLKECNRDIRSFDNPTIGFGVLRRTGANTVNVMKRVKEELAYVNAIDADKEIQLE